MISILSTALVLSSVLNPTLAKTFGRASDHIVERAVVERTDSSTFVPLSMPPLGKSCNYVVLAKTGISTIPDSVVNGDIGISPGPMTYLTGFSFTDAGPGPSSSSQLGNNKAHAPESPEAPGVVTSPQAVSDMMGAYTYAANQPASSDSGLVNVQAPYALTYTAPFGGQIPSGTIFKRGSYRWASTVVIPVGADIYLDGNCGDVFIFYASGAISTGANSNIHLMGTLTSASVFWVTATVLTTGVSSTFNGNILTGTNAVVGTNGVLNGLAQIQTQIALQKATVNKPSFAPNSCQASCRVQFNTMQTLPPVPYVASCTAAQAALGTASACYTNVLSAASSYFAADYLFTAAAAALAATPTNTALQGSYTFASASSAAALKGIQDQATIGLGTPCIGGFTGVIPTPGCTAAESAVATASSCYNGASVAAFNYFAAAGAYGAAATALAQAPANPTSQAVFASSSAAYSTALASVYAQKTVAFGAPCAGAFVGVATPTRPPVPYIASCTVAQSILQTASSCFTNVKSAVTSYYVADQVYSALSTAAAASRSNNAVQNSFSSAFVASTSALNALGSQITVGLGPQCSGGFIGVIPTPGCSLAESAVATATSCYQQANSAVTAYYQASFAYSSLSGAAAARPTNSELQSSSASAAAAYSTAVQNIYAEKDIVFGPACEGAFVGIQD